MPNTAYDDKFKGIGKPFGRAEFDKLLGHCMAVTDAPAIDFGPELIGAYPYSKVILVERDIKVWYKSISKLIEANFRLDLTIFAYLDPYFTSRCLKVCRRNMAFSITRIPPVKRKPMRDKYSGNTMRESEELR